MCVLYAIKLLSVCSHDLRFNLLLLILIYGENLNEVIIILSIKGVEKSI